MNNCTVAFVLALFCLPFFQPGDAEAGQSYYYEPQPDPGPNPDPDPEPLSECQVTADLLLQACHADISDDYSTTLANCNNLALDADRAACMTSAEEAQLEGQAACTEQSDARQDACELLGESRYDPDPLLDPAITFVAPDEVGASVDPNPYISLVSGHTYVLQAGEDGEETVVVHVTDQSVDIQGVACRVVVDIVLTLEEDEDNGGAQYIPEEWTDDWYAQDEAGNVYYCGELSRNYEDGRLSNLDGSFEAGKAFAKSGVLIRAQPVVDQAHRQEFALGEAEDIVQYVNLMATPTEENEAFPCEGNCLKTLDFTPLEPDSSEFKYYLAGVGFVLAEAMEDGELTGEREALVCVGDSLAVLESEACGFEDPGVLLEALCQLSPDVFCSDEP
ncbi:hypothetical protein [Photobacterium atrarenae]|uniref:Uncharacterized protein n=1 Tax=Photobacterium atrarenae TaxID=865757 RepID=A0ABY5GN74_9GAMM|nr:hypothetical protein [Photobacterium atrarenae]UTV30555.1 hypothetical protein NNL38_18495 [Photobacterium atrarenae]